MTLKNIKVKISKLTSKSYDEMKSLENGDTENIVENVGS